jgi:CRP-like cAMP-binding protein
LGLCRGDDDSGILVVVRGALQIYAQAPGDRDVLIGQIGHGNAIGQTARFGGGPGWSPRSARRPVWFSR